MTNSPQVIEMLHDLQRQELDSINPHRIDALKTQHAHDRVRSGVASALVRVAIALDHHAGDRAADRAGDRAGEHATERCT